MKWKRLPPYWPFVRGSHRSAVDSPHNGPVPRAFIFSLMSDLANCWTKNRIAGDLRRNDAHLTSLWWYFHAMTKICLGLAWFIHPYSFVLLCRHRTNDYPTCQSRNSKGNGQIDQYHTTINCEKQQRLSLTIYRIAMYWTHTTRVINRRTKRPASYIVWD